MLTPMQLQLTFASTTGPNCDANTDTNTNAINVPTHNASATGPNCDARTDAINSATGPNCDANTDANITNATRGATVPNCDASSSGSDFNSSSDEYTSDDTDEEWLGEELSEGEEQDNKFFAKVEKLTLKKTSLPPMT